MASKIPILLRLLREGELVVFSHPVHGQMVKRVSGIDQKKQGVFVLGTHEDSLDSRQLGLIPFKRLEGKVIWRVRRPPGGGYLDE